MINQPVKIACFLTIRAPGRLSLGVRASGKLARTRDKSIIYGVTYSNTDRRIALPCFINFMEKKDVKKKKTIYNHLEARTVYSQSSSTKKTNGVFPVL